MKKIIFITLLVLLGINANADVNQAVDNFFSTITADAYQPSIVQNQSAGVLN